MTRLNARIRKQIENNAVAKAGIELAITEMHQRRRDWAEAVRIQALGGSDIDSKIKTAEKKIKNAVKGLPECVVFDETQMFRSDRYIILNVAGCQVYAYFNGGEGSHVRKTTPYRYTLHQGDPLVDEFHAIEKLESELQDKESTIRANVAGATSKVATVKRLLEVWPEAKELLPDDLSPAKKQLPVVKAEDLNAMIGLPSNG